VTPERLVHHELCFGCGRTNLFGLLMDVEKTGKGRVRGRGFVKQDHQGPVPGTAHPGVVAAALSEAMAFAAGGEKEVAAVEFELQAPVPVGVFLEVEASVETGLEPTATACVDGRQVARARALGRR
jgi:acyl-coenzyme A thioesterase PaaI-like protein